MTTALQDRLVEQIHGTACRLAFQWDIDDDSFTYNQTLNAGRQALAEICDRYGIVLAEEPVFTVGSGSLRVTCAAVTIGELVETMAITDTGGVVS